MNPFPQLQPDIERMVDGLLGHVWPGGTKHPPIMDPRAVEPREPDFAWVGGQAVPTVKESLTVEPERPAGCVCHGWSGPPLQICQKFEAGAEISRMCAECLHDEACHGGGHE